MEYCLHKVLQTELLQPPSPEHMLAYCQWDAQKQKSHLVNWQCRPSVCCYTFGIITRNSSHYDVAQFSVSQGTVYLKKYAHGFCFAVLCCGYTLTDLLISIRLTSLALWQSNDCPSASKATLMNMDKYFMWIYYERLHNHNKAKHNKTVCIFLGIYCLYSDIY